MKSKQVADAKKNLNEIRADIENDPEITEEERTVLRSALQQSTKLAGLLKKRPNIFRRIFGKIIGR